MDKEKKSTRNRATSKTTVPGTTEHVREEIILRYLVPPYSLLKSFRQVCNENTDILGKTGASLRRKSSNRRQKLLYLRSKNYLAFKFHCIKYKIVCPDTLQECLQHQTTEIEEEEISEEEISEEESFIEEDDTDSIILSPEKPDLKMANQYFRPKMLLGSPACSEDSSGKY